MVTLLACTIDRLGVGLGCIALNYILKKLRFVLYIEYNANGHATM